MHVVYIFDSAGFRKKKMELEGGKEQWKKTQKSQYLIQKNSK